MKEFKGKTAFVTGAASGIGLALARTFLDRGMNVMMADIEENALDAARHSLSNYSDRVDAIVADSSIADNIQAAANRAFTRFGKIHILCNNAGVSRPGPTETISLSDWEWVIGVNLYGTIHGIRTFVPHMKAHGEPSYIVNTASIAALTPSAMSATYAATKFGIAGITEVLAQELQGTNIGISVLCPGWTRTNMINNGRNRPERYGGAYDVRDDPALAERNKFYRESSAKFGLDPLDLAALVMQAIENNELYIFTQPDRRGAVIAKFDDIEKSFDLLDERLPKILERKAAS